MGGILLWDAAVVLRAYSPPRDLPPMGAPAGHYRPLLPLAPTLRYLSTWCMIPL